MRNKKNYNKNRRLTKEEVKVLKKKNSKKIEKIEEWQNFKYVKSLNCYEAKLNKFNNKINYLQRSIDENRIIDSEIQNTFNRIKELKESLKEVEEERCEGVLKPVEYRLKVRLKCPVCGYSQTYIPKTVLKSNLGIPDVLIKNRNKVR